MEKQLSITYLSECVRVRACGLAYPVGYAEAHVVQALSYKPEGRGFDTRCDFFAFLLS